MKLKVDRKADAAYIPDEFPPGRVARTYLCDPAEPGGMIHPDLDAEGRLLGIEVVGAAKRLPIEVLEAPAEDER
jgi:uncharacterized protein YuzE